MTARTVIDEPVDWYWCTYVGEIPDLVKGFEHPAKKNRKIAMTDNASRIFIPLSRFLSLVSGRKDLPIPPPSVLQLLREHNFRHPH